MPDRIILRLEIPVTLTAHTAAGAEGAIRKRPPAAAVGHNASPNPVRHSHGAHGVGRACPPGGVSVNAGWGAVLVVCSGFTRERLVVCCVCGVVYGRLCVPIFGVGSV